MSASAYQLRHPGEVLAVLDRLQDGRAPLVVTFDDGYALVSSILDVRRDPQMLVFDVAREDAVNDRLFASGTLRFAGELDHIRISFETGIATRTSRADGPAAAVDHPLTVTRLQRRESFRAALQVNPPVHCTIVDAAGWASTTNVFDLSCGGTALVCDEAAVADLVPGSTHELILALPDVGPIGIAANLRTVLPAGDKTSGRIRLGFRFDNVPAKIAAQIQRYVQQVEVQQLRILRRREEN